MIALNVCGAYLFYLIWEVDEAYSIPFMLMLLMLEAAGMEKLDGGFTKAREKLPALRLAPVAAACGLLMIAAGLVWVVSRTGAPVRNYSVLQDQETSKDLLLQTEFSQTFRTGKAFDHIDLWVANWMALPMILFTSSGYWTRQGRKWRERRCPARRCLVLMPIRSLLRR